MKEKILSLFRGNLLQGFAVYLGTSVINKAIPFLLLPILTKYLSPEEYGVLAIYQVMVSFVMPFIGMNMQNNITRNFFSQSKEFIAKLVYNLMVVLTGTFVIVLILISIYLYLGGTRFDIPERWIFALPIIAYMNVFNDFNLTILRNSKKALQYGAFEISKTIIDLSLTILLIVVYNFGWEGRTTGMLLSTIIIGAISFYRIWKNGYLTFIFDRVQIKEILKISIPLIPHALGGVIMAFGDRIFIDQMVGKAEMGIYTVGYQFGMIMILFTTAFNQTWTPWVYELLAKDKMESKVKIVKATYLVGIGFVCLAFLITFISYFLLPLMTTKHYHGAFVHVIWIALGYAFFGMYTLVFPYGVHVGKTSYLGIITFSAAVINMIANYFLIKMNGAVGSAQATLISYIFMFVAVWWYSNKLYPMPWFKFRDR
ncbi:oligosaccharide flippase family protein [Flavobacterium sp. NKUCC04_CG]|uniref:oligosaccharide flippase family protein n=1 Tax=Flavobacterium sp. NKUCC04_CG TaxID=2842121 RepID=UPI001C5B590E|nr:oligosaccharide flippase family protein [Flavobacterium sp. NKUCC04_CG]MBW3517567.1 oligosaccharide flippase family protein [Flavobacterium sp. NKUCC04_CG]